MSDEQPSPEQPEYEEPPVPDLVMVINRAGTLENMMNQAISDYCAPRAEATFFVWSVLLDTSIVALGSKLKVVMAISHHFNFKLPKDAFSKVIQLRNSYAHHPTNAHPVVVFGKKPEEGNVYHQFWTLDGSGVLKARKQHEAFEEFNVNYKIARDSLRELLVLIRDDVVNSKGEPRMNYPMPK